MLESHNGIQMVIIMSGEWKLHWKNLFLLFFHWSALLARDRCKPVECCVDVRAAWWKVDLKTHLLACCVPFFAPLGFKEHSGTWELDYVHAQASRGWRFWNSSKNTLYIITQPFICFIFSLLLNCCCSLQTTMLILIFHIKIETVLQHRPTIQVANKEALLFCLNTSSMVHQNKTKWTVVIVWIDVWTISN